MHDPRSFLRSVLMANLVKPFSGTACFAIAWFSPPVIVTFPVLYTRIHPRIIDVT